LQRIDIALNHYGFVYRKDRANRQLIRNKTAGLFRSSVDIGLSTRHGRLWGSLFFPGIEFEIFSEVFQSAFHFTARWKMSAENQPGR
jgi:hypothetical protein